jgi:hypothetical protein
MIVIFIRVNETTFQVQEEFIDLKTKQSGTAFTNGSQ